MFTLNDSIPSTADKWKFYPILKIDNKCSVVCVCVGGVRASQPWWAVAIGELFIPPPIQQGLSVAAWTAAVWQSRGGHKKNQAERGSQGS